jgi:hypothetical protein
LYRKLQFSVQQTDTGITLPWRTAAPFENAQAITCVGTCNTLRRSRPRFPCLDRPVLRSWDTPRPSLPIVARRSWSIRTQLDTGAHGVVQRNLWPSRALTEVSPHLRGGELRAAVPTAEHAWTRRPSAPIGFSGQMPHRFLNRGPPRTIREMPSHLTVGELGAAAPSARHPRPCRAPNESVWP